MENYSEQIRQFVNETFLFGQGIGELSDDDSFLDRGIIDSTGVLELVGFIQDKYNLRLEDEELIPENLDSINRVAAFVQTKIAAAPVAPALCS